MIYKNLTLGNELKLLNRFMRANEFTFVISGTTALQIIGADPSEHNIGDIDVIVYAEDYEDEQRLKKLFKMYDSLAGGHYEELRKKDEYKDIPYTIKVGDSSTKVNVWVKSGKYVETEVVQVVIESDYLLVHNFAAAMNRKMKLMRQKDFMFANSLIRLITEIQDSNFYKNLISRRA